MARQKNLPIQPRVWSRADAELPYLNEENMLGLTKWREYLFEDLGIVVNEDNAIPTTNQVPRIFVLHSDDDGRERPMSLEAAGLQPGSPEFWRQVQLGNVYAFPTGQAAPVQLQLGLNENDRATLGYSEPVHQDQVPATPAKPLGFWKRVAWFFTGGYAFNHQRLAYKMRDVSNVTVTAEFENMANKRANCAQTEEREVQAHKEVLAQRKLREELPDLLKASKKRQNHNQIGLSRMTKLFKPVPEYDPQMDMELPENAKKGLYHKSKFDQHLTPFGKDQIDLEIPPVDGNGQRVTDEEFAAVVMYTLWDPEFAMVGDELQGHDRHLIQSLKDLGCEEKDFPMLVTAQTRCFYTNDLFMGTPRQNSDIFFEKVTDPGRRKAVDAMKDYLAGDKDKLAQIIANGINMAAGDVLAVNLDPIDEQSRGNFVASSKLLGLLERDPALKELCLKKGMDSQRLKTVEGMREMLRLEDQANAAEVRLGEAARDGVNLSREEKHNLAKAFLKSRISMVLLKNDNCSNQPRYQEMEDKRIHAVQYEDNNLIKNWRLHPDQRPAPQHAHIWLDSANKCATTFQVVYRTQPKSVQALTTEAGQQELDRLADQIVRQKGLADKSPMDLYLQFTKQFNKFKLNDAILQAVEVLHPQQPQVQNQPQVQGGQGLH